MNQIGETSEAVQYIKVCESVLSKGIDIYPIGEIRQEILEDKTQMTLYGEKSASKLLSNYKKKLEEIRSLLYDSDQEQFILNILEYIKFTVSEEEYIGIPGILFFESINNFPYSSLLIGKGTGNSQTRLMSDLLCDSSYELAEITMVDEENPYKELERYSVLLKDTQYHDPLHYDGNKKRIFTTRYNSYVKEIEYNEEKKNKARKKITDYLINKLKIRNISEELFDSNDSVKEKLNKIIEYIKKNCNKSNLSVRYHIVELEGIRIETSRLLELFLIANSILYDINQSNKKENSIFEIKSENDLKIDINSILESSDEKNKIFQKA